MDIVIIGSGNVASVLGRMFLGKGHRILQIVSRNAKDASALAYEWDTESANYLTVINRDAEVYIIAVSDNALPSIAADLRLPGKIVAHTAGSVPKNILTPVSEHHGVFYPLQSIRKNVQRIPDIPIFFEGNDELTTSRLKLLADSISTPAAMKADSTDRMKLHIAAIFVSNFTNHLYDLAEQYCRQEGLDFRLLLPLIRETAERLEILRPGDTLTGPAVRNDRETISKHLHMLAAYPDLENVYRFLTESIQSHKN